MCSTLQKYVVSTLHLYSQLRVFAKYALKGVKGVLEDVDPDCKGFTLPESAVEPHTHFLITENTDDSNEVLGQKLLHTCTH